MLTVVLSGSTFQIQQQEFCLRNKILPFFHHVSPYVRPSQVHLNFSQWFDGFVSHVSHESISSSSSTRSHMMIVIWSSYYHMDLTSTLWIVNALDFILSIFSYSLYNIWWFAPKKSTLIACKEKSCIYTDRVTCREIGVEKKQCSMVHTRLHISTLWYTYVHVEPRLGMILPKMGQLRQSCNLTLSWCDRIKGIE